MLASKELELAYKCLHFPGSSGKSQDNVFRIFKDTGTFVTTPWSPPHYLEVECDFSELGS